MTRDELMSLTGIDKSYLDQLAGVILPKFPRGVKAEYSESMVANVVFALDLKAAKIKVPAIKSGVGHLSPESLAESLDAARFMDDEFWTARMRLTSDIRSRFMFRVIDKGFSSSMIRECIWLTDTETARKWTKGTTMEFIRNASKLLILGTMSPKVRETEQYILSREFTGIPSQVEIQMGSLSDNLLGAMSVEASSRAVAYIAFHSLLHIESQPPKKRAGIRLRKFVVPLFDVEVEIPESLYQFDAEIAPQRPDHYTPTGINEMLERVAKREQAIEDFRDAPQLSFEELKAIYPTLKKEEYKPYLTT